MELLSDLDQIFNTPEPLDIACFVGKRGSRICIARIMPLCNSNCMVFAIFLMVQLICVILERSMYYFNTLQELLQTY